MRKDVPVLVALAKREFEAWLLTAIESLRGQRGLPANLIPPDNPEDIAGAKEWLSRHMGGKYSETIDQPAFTARFDLDQARQARSFARFYDKFTDLLRLLRDRNVE